MLGGLAQSTRLLRAGVDAVRATAAITHSAVVVPASGAAVALAAAPALLEAPRQAAHLALKVAPTVDRVVGGATTLTRGGISLAEKIGREAEPAARALTDL